MKNFVLLATSWHPRHGGIDTFNRDFAIGLASVGSNKHNVFCVVPACTLEEKQDALRHNIELISIEKDSSVIFEGSWVFDAYFSMKRLHPSEHIDWWVGHDVISGRAALKGRVAAPGSLAAVIMHMNYSDYQSPKHGVGLVAVQREREQQEVFRNANCCFAVGPLLRDALQDLLPSGTSANMLVPGFPKVTTKQIRHRFKATVLGRMDPENDRIKQVSLAVASFGEAVQKAWANGGIPSALCKNPQLRVIGISEAGGEEEGRLRSLAQSRAGRRINLIAVPFGEAHANVLDELSLSSVALLLSWHEGFGLSGWESIAAEVPLILSGATGLWNLLAETLGEPVAAGYVQRIDIRGEEGSSEAYSQNDLIDVRDALIRTAERLDDFRTAAKELKSILVDHLQCTWTHTAEAFLEALPSPPDALHSRVLIVEDDENLMAQMKEYLVEAGFQDVHLVATGMDAILASDALRPDAVVLDLGLSDMSGTEVLAALRRKGANPKVVVASGRDLSAVTAVLEKLGVDDFIPKDLFFLIGAQKIINTLRYGTGIQDKRLDVHRVIESQLSIIEILASTISDSDSVYRDIVYIREILSSNSPDVIEQVRVTIGDINRRAASITIINLLEVLTALLLLIKSPEGGWREVQ